MRGADINYVNKKNGFTPLHFAIENNMNSKIVNFLIKHGADPHIEDFSGKDCCDKAKDNERYKKLATLSQMECKYKPHLRKKPGKLIEQTNEERKQKKLA